MESTNSIPKRLISATVLERDHGIPKSSAYRLAKEGKIPHFKVGPKLTGVRFIAEEVLACLRQPINGSNGTGNHED